MATQTFYGINLANCTLAPTVSSATTFSLNASNNAIAAIFVAEDVGTHGPLVGLQYSCASITGAQPTLRASIQGVTSRSPDATVKGGGSPASQTFTAAAGVGSVTFANTFTPTNGDILSAVIDYSSGTIGGSNLATFNRSFSTLGSIGHPFVATQTAGTWSQFTLSPCVAPVYQDGYIARGCAVMKAIQNNVAASTSYGSLWTQSIGGVFCGATVVARIAAGSNIQVTLYEGTSTTISSTTVVSQSTNMACNDFSASAGAGLAHYVSMPQYTLRAGSTYRLVVANSGTAYTTLASVTFASQVALQSIGGQLAGTTGAAGTFTDFASSTDWRSVPVYPAILSLTESGGVSAARQFVGMVH